MKKTNVNKEALDRAIKILEAHYSHELPTELEGRVRMWFSDENHIEEKYAALEKVFENKVNYDSEPTDEAYESFEQASRLLGFPEQATREPKPTARRVSLRRRLAVRIAAVVAPILLLAGVGYMLVERGTIGAGRMAEVTVGRTAGTTEKVDLSDGTVIVAQAGSVVRYAKRFDDVREVELSGKAHFNVTKLGGRPFVVRTAHVAVTVLGTEFTVTEYPEADSTTVMLYTGRIEVEAGGNKYAMVPGENFVFNHVSGEVRITDIEAEVMVESGYAPGLKMNNKSLGQIIAAIEANYNVKFDVPEGAGLEGNFSVDFTGETLENILKYLNIINSGYNFRGEGNRVIMSK